MRLAPTAPPAARSVRVTVDGELLELPEGRNLLQALDEADSALEIPHLCWHPALGHDGSCGVCIVERLGGTPADGARAGLESACAVKVEAGLQISTRSEAVRAARSERLGALLAVHPLDCPVCDAAGECALQRYTARYRSDAAPPAPQPTPDRPRRSFGEQLWLEPSRCVGCSRCVRFCHEVSGSNALQMQGVGPASVAALSPQAASASTGSSYELNLEELCPVGAITLRGASLPPPSFSLEERAGLCGGCGRGCNLNAGLNGSSIVRLRARRNDAVNHTWLCDEGRRSFESTNHGRQRDALLRDEEGGRQSVTLAAAVDASANQLKQVIEARGGGAIGVLLSAHAGNEDAHVVRQLLDAIGVTHFAAACRRGERDALLRVEEQAPNAAGVCALGFGDAAPLLERVRAGEVAALLVLGTGLWPLVETLGEDRLAALDTMVVLDSQQTELLRFARVVLPGLHHFEKRATHVNVDGRVQRSPAVTRPAWPALGEGGFAMRLGAALGLAPFAAPDAAAASVVTPWSAPWRVEALSRAWADATPGFAGCAYEALGATGRVADTLDGMPS